MQTYYVLQKTDPNQHTRIIRGNFHHGDQRFADLSRGKQTVTVSVVALCFLKLNDNPASWKTVDIDKILNYGDIQYHASYKEMKREGKRPQEKYLLISEVYSYTKVGRNYFCFNESNYVYEKEIFNLENLEKSLYRFFFENNNNCGVFTYNIYSFAIMRKFSSFFLLNSHATSYAGVPMDPNDNESAACLMEMFTIRCLANHLLVACNHEQIIFNDSDTLNCYSMVNLNIEKKVFGKDTLKRQQVNRHLCIAESNRGGIKRKYKSELHEDGKGHLYKRPNVVKNENSEEHTLLKQSLVRS